MWHLSHPSLRIQGLDYKKKIPKKTYCIEAFEMWAYKCMLAISWTLKTVERRDSTTNRPKTRTFPDRHHEKIILSQPHAQVDKHELLHPKTTNLHGKSRWYYECPCLCLMSLTASFTLTILMFATCSSVAFQLRARCM